MANPYNFGLAPGARRNHQDMADQFERWAQHRGMRPANDNNNRQHPPHEPGHGPRHVPPRPHEPAQSNNAAAVNRTFVYQYLLALSR